MWIAELVKNVITGHIRIPRPNAIEGQMYGRQRRRAHTSSPTIACESRISPRSRNPVAKNQCTISLRGSIGLREVGQQRARDQEREGEPGRDDEQRWLGDEPPEALVVRVQQRDPVRLGD